MLLAKSLPQTSKYSTEAWQTQCCEKIEDLSAFWKPISRVEQRIERYDSRDKCLSNQEDFAEPLTEITAH